MKKLFSSFILLMALLMIATPVLAVRPDRGAQFIEWNLSADVMYEVLIAELATQRGNPEIASKFYVDAAKQSNDPEIASRAVRIASFANRKEDALAAAKIWLQNEPDNEEAQRIAAVLHLRNENYEEAKALLQKLIDAEPDAISRNILLTGALLQRGH